MAKLPKTKSESLRHPGQSLDEKIDRVVLDDFMGYYLLAAGLWLLAILEWLSKVFHYPRMPVAYAVAAAAATVLCVVKFVSTKRELRSLRQGRDGDAKSLRFSMSSSATAPKCCTTFRKSRGMLIMW
jgi:hypothetical protein